MAKLDPNSLRPTPESDPFARGRQDFAPWQQFLQEINHLLVDDQYAYAEFTLRGIKQSVEGNHIVTDGQRRAVANISGSPRRATDQTRNYKRKWDR